jgi:hypothetical protein
MRIACWMPKATDTDSEYVILIAFVLQKWLHKRASELHHKHIICVIWIYERRVLDRTTNQSSGLKVLLSNFGAKCLPEILKPESSCYDMAMITMMNQCRKSSREKSELELWRESGGNVS